MVIILILLYSTSFVGLWLLLKSILKQLLKDKFRPSYLIICYLIFLPLLIIALGFLALALIPAEIPD